MSSKVTTGINRTKQTFDIDLILLFIITTFLIDYKYQ
jgi:hypothetical protein